MPSFLVLARGSDLIRLIALGACIGIPMGRADSTDQYRDAVHLAKPANPAMDMRVSEMPFADKDR